MSASQIYVSPSQMLSYLARVILPELFELLFDFVRCESESGLLLLHVADIDRYLSVLFG